MNINNLSSAFTTKKIEETRDFYINYFDAKVTFDCGWYVNLQFGNELSTLQFMSPQQPEQPFSDSAGLMYNFSVSDVDKEYKRLTDAGLEVIVPLEDHPWGDRGFAIHDPNGITLYIYSDREPSEEFKQYYK
ncbi:VOC family protein [Desulfomarina sp.]